MLITLNGIIIQMCSNGVSLLGRNTSGVKMINLDKNDKVVGIAKVREKITNIDDESVTVDENVIEDIKTEETEHSQESQESDNI